MPFAVTPKRGNNLTPEAAGELNGGKMQFHNGLRRCGVVSVLAIAAALVGGCQRSPEALAVESNSDLIADEPAEPETSSSGDVQGSMWNVSVETDPMNDDTIYSATGRLENAGYTLLIEAKCTNNRKLTYELSTFKADQGAPISSNTVLFMGVQRLTSIDVRIDGGKAVTWTSSNNKYQNYFKVYDHDVISKRNDGSFYNSDVEIQGVEADHSLYASKLHKAKSATIRIQFSDGVGTFVIDQTEPNLRGVLDRCPVNTGEIPSTAVQPVSPNQTSDGMDQPNKTDAAPAAEVEHEDGNTI